MDEEKLAELAAKSSEGSLEPSRKIGILHLPGGQKLYTAVTPAIPAMTGREEGDIRGIRMELWEDDDSEEFARVYERIDREGAFEADD